MKKLLLFIGSGLLILLAILLGRTLLFTSKQVIVEPVSPPSIAIDDASSRLAGAVQFETIAVESGMVTDSSAFFDMHAYLSAQFPTVYATLSTQLISDLSIIYTWTGRRSELEPVVLMSHLDVVPALEEHQPWTYPAFSGTIDDGYIWGRGTLDDKSGVLGILEAVELLLSEGFQPDRTVIIAFGHDEEVGGIRGASQIAAWLKAQNIRPAFVLDEGGAIVEDVIPGIDQRVALVGIAEKGYLSLELKTEGEGGHSSMPPKQTAIGILSAALTRLDENPLPAELGGVGRIMFDYLGPEMPFLQRVVFANLWLFEGVISQQLEQSPSTNAVVRTTLASTIFDAGVKDNVLPPYARAVINMRLLPGTPSSDVIRSVEHRINDDRVEVKPYGVVSEPSPISTIESGGFPILTTTIHQVVGKKGVLIAPYLVVGGTDSKHFTGLTDQIFRFMPFSFRGDERKRIHGMDERISIDDYQKVIHFYYQLIQNVQVDPL